MADAQICRSVPYYSNPDIVIPALLMRLFGKDHAFNAKKPPERLGTPIRNNARWIKENRFILENVGDEGLTCPHRGFRISPKKVDCILYPNYGCNKLDW